MTGWILFTAVISLVIGIVFGWFFCIWALDNHIARNGNGILKKEEKDGGYRRQEFNRTIFIWLKDSNVPLIYFNAVTYEKGSFFCIYDGSKFYKYPVANIWRVEDKRTTYAEPK